MTASTYPRSAAMYGFTRVSSYSACNCRRRASTSSPFLDASASCERYTNPTAPEAPMTAICAVGQATLTSAPMSLEPMTQYAPP
ncbi:Uncharacterised protein [Mycobacteroides abscessus subsp. massiliense]|nr:Uncharacterised protein [Mycobacteroides abscessus subsp. massiliense]